PRRSSSGVTKKACCHKAVAAVLVDLIKAIKAIEGELIQRHKTVSENASEAERALDAITAAATGDHTRAAEARLYAIQLDLATKYRITKLRGKGRPAGSTSPKTERDHHELAAQMDAALTQYTGEIKKRAFTEVMKKMRVS